MRLLICTQIVDENDAVLGFMHAWIAAFAQHAEEVTVIALYARHHSLPENVTVHSLGKEDGVSKFTYLWRFYKYVWKYCNQYDGVFVHMNQIYVLLAGILWRLWGKRVGMWYAHGTVSFTLRAASVLAHDVFTSTESGYRIRNNKKRIVGQGINTELFAPVEHKQSELYRLISIGRISRSKDYATLINALELLEKASDMKMEVSLVGEPLTSDDKKYQEELEKRIAEKNLETPVTFVGPVANKDIISYLHEHDLFVNMGLTGSLDKAMLEAFAAGLPVVTCNRALSVVIDGYEEDIFYERSDSEGLAARIQGMCDLPDEKRSALLSTIRGRITRQHGLDRLVQSILSYYPHS